MKQNVHDIKISIPIELESKIVHMGNGDISSSVSLILEKGLVNLETFSRSVGFSKPSKGVPPHDANL